MQPVLARGSRLGVYLLASLLLGGLLSVALARRDLIATAQAAAVVLPLVVVYGFVCLSSWYVCRATPLETSSGTTILANIGGATLFATLVWLVLARLLAWAAASVPALGGSVRLVSDEVVLLFTVGALLYLLAIAAHYVILGVDEARATEKRALEVQLLAREAELKALRAQIEPHFLFNSLNSISALTTVDPAGARRMCVLLAEFLRVSLTLGTRERITLDDEVNLVERYFEIERVRFGDRLQFIPAIDPATRPCQVPPLLLQPLAENAVSHGIARLLEGGTVRLDAKRVDGTLRIVMENPMDDGAAETAGGFEAAGGSSSTRSGRSHSAARDARATSSGSGVGLANVRRRLATHYGNQATFAADSLGGSFRVTITLPAGQREKRR